MKQGLLIWDLDDTLIITNREYEKTNQECAEIVSEAIFGSSKETESILERQRKHDLAMVLQYGFVRPRYLHSWLRTLEEFSKKYNVKISGSTIQKVADAVNDLYRRKFDNVPGATEVLTELKNEGYSMIVLTAGDEEVQHKRIKDAGISEFFEAVYVYPFKTPEILKEVLSNYEGQIHFMIGNSLRSDIYPALENNVGAIHVIRETWEIDDFNVDINHPLYFSVQNLIEIPELLKTMDLPKVALL